MHGIAKGLIVLSGVSFLLAILGAFLNTNLLGVGPEGFSRACTNLALLGIGIAGGLAELFSAWLQGLIGAAGCRAISEGEGKGLVFIIIAMGIVETVGLFGFVFLLLVLPKPI